MTRAFNDIDGASARVSLRKKQAKVLCDRQIDSRVILESIEKKGYKATETD